ncbi:hypothetical protein Tco_1135043 [Tanacetum coccineum]
MLRGCNHQNKLTQPSSKRIFVQTIVVTKSDDKLPVNVAPKAKLSRANNINEVIYNILYRIKGIIFHDQEEHIHASTKTFSSSQSQLPQVKDKGKGKMVEPEVPLKKKDQVALDEEMARNLEAQLQAKLIEEERLARQKEEEANIALIESWDNTQAMMEADFKLAQRLQAEEQGEITIKERSGVLQSGIKSLRYIDARVGCIKCYVLIIMVNVIPPDHVDDVPVVEPNHHDDVLVVPEPVLVDEDEDSEEEEFEEDEEPQEEEDDMEVDIEEDENEPELTYPYEEVDPLNPSPPASESKPEDVIEVENTIEHEDKTVPARVHEIGESSTAPFLQEDSDGLLPGLMRRDINSLFGRMASLSRRLCGHEMAHALVEKKGKAKDEYYGKLILDLGNEVRSSVEQGTAAMERLVEKLGNAEDKAESKKLKKELEEARFSNTFLCMQNERVERDLYWTRVRAHEFYQEMIRRRFVFEERPNEAIDVPIEDENSPSSKPRGSPRDS